MGVYPAVEDAEEYRSARIGRERGPSTGCPGLGMTYIRGRAERRTLSEESRCGTADKPELDVAVTASTKTSHASGSTAARAQRRHAMPSCPRAAATIRPPTARLAANTPPI